jgi:uncharacterized protein
MTSTSTEGPATRPAKPIPVVDDASRPFFEAALDGRLLLRRCTRCATFVSPFVWLGGGAGAPLRPHCWNCFSDQLEWAESTGRGEIYSFAVMHQLYDPAFADDVPYNITVVELEEGVRMTANVVDCANDDLAVGLPVETVFEQLSDDVAVPKFRLAR